MSYIFFNPTGSYYDGMGYDGIPSCVYIPNHSINKKPMDKTTETKLVKDPVEVNKLLSLGWRVTSISRIATRYENLNTNSMELGFEMKRDIESTMLDKLLQWTDRVQAFCNTRATNTSNVKVGTLLADCPVPLFIDEMDIHDDLNKGTRVKITIKATL